MNPKFLQQKEKQKKTKQAYPLGNQYICVLVKSKSNNYFSKFYCIIHGLLQNFSEKRKGSKQKICINMLETAKNRSIILCRAL